MNPGSFVLLAVSFLFSAYGWWSANARARLWRSFWLEEIRKRHEVEDKYHRLVLAIARKETGNENLVIVEDKT